MSGLGGLNKSPDAIVLRLVQLQLPNRALALIPFSSLEEKSQRLKELSSLSPDFYKKSSVSRTYGG
jgi:hypothetical protein